MRMKCEPRDANWKKIPATSAERAGFRKGVRATCLGNWADGASAGPVPVRLGQLTKGLDLGGLGAERPFGATVRLAARNGKTMGLPPPCSAGDGRACFRVLVAKRTACSELGKTGGCSRFLPRFGASSNGFRERSPKAP